MLLDNYKIYVKEIISLVDSMVIKSSVDADSINTQLTLQGVEVDYDDPTTWKYYLNLSGSYHANDQRINIVSSDTQEEIELNKENLLEHPITRVEYGPGGIYHNTLVAGNTKMRHFIDGVFNPVDIDTAVSATDFQILYFDNRYIASNEVELMDHVQAFVYNYVSRWHISDYNEADDLYTAAMFDQLYKSLVTAIINIRTSFCNTSQVCEFHLWSKLKGLYGLDVYKGLLTQQQALWLYRNVRHVILHAGSQYILEDMIEKLINTANLEAFKYDYVKIEDNLHKSLVPDGRFVKREFNDSVIDIDEEVLLATEESVLYECIEEAPENEREFDYDVKKLKDIPYTTTVNQFPTGLIKIEPMSNVVTDRFNDQQFKLDYWVYLCSLDMFEGTYIFDLGSLGTKTLSAKQALILYIYANTKASGVRLDTVPSPRITNVVRQVTPSFSIVKDSVASDLISDEDITRALKDTVVPRTVSSYEEFDNFVETVISRKIQHDFQWQGEGQHLKRAMLKDMIDGIHLTTQVDLVEGSVHYIDWLGSIKVTDSGINEYEWYSISLTILKTLLDLDPNSTALPSSQKAVIEILDKLSGYSIIVTAGESRLGYKDIDWFFSRTGDLESDDTGSFNGYMSELKVEYDSRARSSHINSAELPLVDLQVIDLEADTVRGDPETGLYFESYLEDFHDQIVNMSGFAIELID